MIPRSNKILIILSSSIILFCLIAILIFTGATKQFDERILLLLRQTKNTAIPVGPAWLQDFMTDISSMGSVSVIIIVTLFVSGFFIIKKNYYLLRVILFAAIGGGVSDLLLKGIFERHRPEIVPHLVNVNSWSFPSGHSVMSAVVYLSLAVIFIPLNLKEEIKNYILTSAIIITLLIGISRVYLGVHYPTDVIGGWTLGIIWSCISAFFTERISSHSLAETADV